MFDRWQFRGEIKAQLQDMPLDKQVAFAVRSALRVLPLLTVLKEKTSPDAVIGSDREAFGFWKAEDKKRYLLSVLSCYGLGIEVVFTREYSTEGALLAPFFLDADTDNSAALAAAYSAYCAAVDVANTRDAADAAADAAAAAVATYAAAFTAADTVINATRQDLAALTKTTAKDLLEQSLWPERLPDKWQILLHQFKADALSLNAGFEIWLDWYDDRLIGRPIDVELLNQWNNISVELIAQGVERVNAYLKSLVQRYATHPLNRVRAIFIGYGEAGKTSLIRALHGEEVIEGKEGMTAGIEIRDWPVPDTNIQAHFWDFGGQVVFHSTHKFFLRSSCVYIIVINARADINNSQQAEYWLDHVKVFGNSAPVILVGNKADEAQIYLQMENLKQKYPNIKGFYSVSCTEATSKRRHEFEAFKQALTQELQAVGIHQMLFTPAQGKVLEELQQNAMKDAFMSTSEFQKLCDKYQVSDEGELNRDWLVDIFDKLGVMLHFEELKNYHDAYLLNPRWLTHGVYSLMNAKKARINEADMVRILANTKVQDEYQHLLSYPKLKCLFIIKTMQRFKLCYPLHDEANTMLIPALLDDELSSYPAELKNSDTLHFEFAFSGFLPRNLIGEFMVSRHEEIKDSLQSQRGAVFKKRNLQAEALVEADYHRRLIVMQVYGRDAKEYLTILYDAMKGIFGDLKLEYTEYVYLPKSACINQQIFKPDQAIERADYNQLLATAKAGQTFYITGSGLHYDLSKVLNFILPDAKQSEIVNIINAEKAIFNQNSEVDMSTITQTVTNSTVQGSIVAAKNIENSFNSLKESKANDAVKSLLAQLLKEIQELNSKVPASQVIEDMSQDAQVLVAETKREPPRKERLSISLDGITEAAQAVGEIAKPIWAVAEKLSPLLLGM